MLHESFDSVAYGNFLNILQLKCNIYSTLPKTKYFFEYLSVLKIQQTVHVSRSHWLPFTQRISRGHYFDERMGWTYLVLFYILVLIQSEGKRVHTIFLRLTKVYSEKEIYVRIKMKLKVFFNSTQFISYWNKNILKMNKS